MFNHCKLILSSSLLCGEKLHVATPLPSPHIGASYKYNDATASGRGGSRNSWKKGGLRVLEKGQVPRNVQTKQPLSGGQPVSGLPTAHASQVTGKVW